MAEAIKNFFSRIHIVFDRNLFDLGPGEPRIETSDYICPSVEEGWRQDWENIGGDFRRAVNRFAAEHAT